MNQKEFLKAIVAEAKEREIELSQVIVKELLEIIENAIDNAVLEGKTVKTLGLKFERKVKENETSGTVKQKDGTAVTWTKAPHSYPSVKYLKSKKDELTREI